MHSNQKGVGYPLKLILLLSPFLLTIVLVGISGIIFYKKSLRQKSWFESFHLQFESAECPHTKTVPYAETFGLAFKRKEKRVKKVILNKSDIWKEVTFRLRCDACGKKRYFRLIDTPETAAFQKHKILYILGTFVAIFLVYGVLVAPALTLLSKLFNL